MQSKPDNKMNSYQKTQLKEKKEVTIMSLSLAIEKYHKLIIVIMAIMIVFFLTACLFHDTMPICHYLFGCDHRLH